jgi:hypothetical protein
VLREVREEAGLNGLLLRQELAIVEESLLSSLLTVHVLRHLFQLSPVTDCPETWSVQSDYGHTFHYSWLPLHGLLPLTPGPARSTGSLISTPLCNAEGAGQHASSSLDIPQSFDYSIEYLSIDE